MSREEPSLAYGGQALIEGVMMRSGNHLVMAVRKPDHTIDTTSMILKRASDRNKVFGLPFVRGVVSLVEMMYVGMKTLMHSANLALEEEGEDESFTLMDYALLIGAALLINGLFIAIPFVLTNYLGITGVLFNLVESALRMSLFVAYLYGISRWEEMARVLQYHGAEHKTINAHEAGAELEPETVSKFSRLNPRCGTSFLFLTLITSIALFSLIPRTTFLIRLGSRILLIPVISGISFELLKLSDRHRDSPAVKMLIRPGLLFQRLTTKEPDHDMIQVAIAALTEVKRLSELQA